MQIPYYSQYAADVPEIWRDRACGAMALKMGLDTLGAETPSPNDFIEAGVAVGAWQEDGGYWIHDRLAILAHNYGIPAYREEFRSGREDLVADMRAYGMRKIAAHLGHGGLVMVSVPKHMVAGGSYHLVLLTKNEGDTLTYQDPAYETATEGAARTITHDAFSALWRGLAIFLG